MTGAFQLCFAPCTACEYQNSPGFTPCTPYEYQNSPGFTPCTACEYRNSPGFASCTVCEYQNSPGFAPCTVCEHSNVIQIAIKRAPSRGSGDKCRRIRLPLHPPPGRLIIHPCGMSGGRMQFAPTREPGQTWQASLMPLANFLAPAGAVRRRPPLHVPGRGHP